GSGAGLQHQRARTHRRAAAAGDGVDIAEHRLHRVGAAGADTDGEARSRRTRGGGVGGREGDGLAVDDQRGAVGDAAGGQVVGGGAGGTDQLRGRCNGDRRRIVVVHCRAGGGGAGKGRGDGAGGGCARERRIGEARAGAEQVVGGGAGNRRGRDARLGRIADRGLQHLVGDRLGAGDQALQRGDAGVGGLQDLHAVADTVEQIGDVAGAVVERGGGEEAGRVVQRGVDLVAGGEVVLRGGEQRSGRLQRKQVLANRCRENNASHNYTPLRVLDTIDATPFFLGRPCHTVRTALPVR